MHITRRHFGAIAGGALASLAFGNACRRSSGSDIPNDGRLTARPHANIKASAIGEIMLGLDRARDAIRLELPANFVAPHGGHGDVEQDQVGPVLGGGVWMIREQA